MAQAKRMDGRKFDEMRPRSIKVGVVKNADGSAIYQQGRTKVLAAVYGPKTLHPQRLRDVDKGKLRVTYRMLPFSVEEHKSPKPGRRDIELGLVIKEALESSIFLEEFGNAVVDVHVYILQSDAGSRCASICAASLALADAGIPMRDLVSSVAGGLVNGQPVIDLTADEEHTEGAVDMAMAYNENLDKLTLLQMDGRIDDKQLMSVIDLAIKCSKQIKGEMIDALKSKYGDSK